MHISDGVLSAPVWIGGYIATSALIAFNIKKMAAEDMPRVALVTACFFVASLLHIPVGPASVHLVLNGLVGIILGPLVFVSILVGLLLQTLLFQHGGITTLGVNTLIVGLPALLAHRLFKLHKIFNFRGNESVLGFLAGAIAVFGAAIILALCLITTGEEFRGVAKYAIFAHLPVMVIEGGIAAFAVSFLRKVQPEILA